MKKYLDIHGIIWSGISFDINTNSLSILLSKNIIRPYIEQLEEQKLSYTDYNRHTIKWFKLREINTNTREIIVSFRYRYQKLEDKPIFGGRFTIYDNATDVIVGVNFEINNKQILGQTKIHSFESDWASGILGYIEDVYDIFTGSIMWLIKGNFVRITDIFSSIGSLVANLSFEDKLRITEPFNEINELNSKKLIYLNKIDYDAEGLWLVFKIDESRLVESVPIINSLIGKYKN